jgi:hypothetical protein
VLQRKQICVERDRSPTRGPLFLPMHSKDLCSQRVIAWSRRELAPRAELSPLEFSLGPLSRTSEARGFVEFG